MTNFRILKSCLTAILLAVGATSVSAAVTSDFYESKSVLNQGKWVKIKVAEDGIHQITYQQLRDWGFSDPSKVKVYGYGGTALTNNRFPTSQTLEDLTQQYAIRYPYANPDRIIFYGVADLHVRLMSNTVIDVKRNLYSTDGYYFLSDANTPDVSRTSITYYSGRENVECHSSIVYEEKDLVNPSSGGAFFFGNSILDTPEVVSFPFRDVARGGSFEGTLLYRFAANYNADIYIEQTPLNDAFTISGGNVPYISLETNATEVKTFRISSRDAQSLRFGSENSGTWDMQFRLNKSSNPAVTFAALDYAALIYNRKNTLQELPQLKMYFPGATVAKNFKVYDVNQNAQVWNVSDPSDVKAFRVAYNNPTSSLTASFPATTGSASTDGALEVIVFNPAMQQLPVEFVADVDNQNLHAEEIPDMVIITPAKLLSQAERLAAIHNQYQGMTVKVTTPDVIFNEFSSGTPSAMGIRRYAKYNYDRSRADGSGKFRFLLFFGLGSWDNRHIVTVDEEHLVTYQTESENYAAMSPTCYASDAYFGMMSDSFTTDSIASTMMNLNVGRMPIDNISDAKVVVDKIEDYFINPPVHGSYNRALLFCDDGDTNSHLIQAEAIAEQIKSYSPATTTTKIYNALYPWNNDTQKDAVVFRQKMAEALRLGQGYMSYAGHGRADRLGYDQNLWNLANIEATTYPVSPFTMLATCNTFCFDRKAMDITGHMLRATNGGAINVVAACREVYKDQNHILAVAVADAYFKANPGEFAGDVFRNARNSVIISANTPGSRSPRLAINTLCYNFAGDPAIPLHVPSYDVVTTKVDDVVVADLEEDAVCEVYPLKPFRLQGAVVDKNGNKVTDFNGTISVEIYDGAYDTMSSAKGEANSSYTSLVHIDEVILAQRILKVRNGEFDDEIMVPATIRPEGTNRISYYATGNNNTRFASGAFTGFNVKDFDINEVSAETEPLRITDFYINNPEFSDGDEVNSSITVFINVKNNKAGFDVSNGKIGNNARLMLDGTYRYTDMASYFLPDENGDYSLEYNINELKDGYHTLEFSIADNAGNREFMTRSFLVVNRQVVSDLQIDADPARESAEFTIRHSFTSGEPAGRFVVEDEGGNTVFTRENCSFPFTWNLLGNDGVRVPDGHYKAYVTLKSGLQYSNTEKIPFIVIK